MTAVESQRHIFVINDTPALLEMFTEILEDEGYRVTTDRFAEPPETLLAEIKAQAPDLLILDLLVGGEAIGWQLLQMVKLDRETHAVPCLLCTAAVRQAKELEDHLNELGVMVLLKPFDIDVLIETLHQVWTPTAAKQPGAGTEATSQTLPSRGPDA